MKCDFTYRHYQECIELAKSKSYEFYRLCDYASLTSDSKKSIFMRHDVDHCLDLALNMAELERDLGVNSTYYVRMHSKNYNVLSLQSTKKLRSIIAMGHEVGLHYEPSYAEIMNIDKLKFLKSDLSALENCLSYKVVGVSPHEPTREGTFKIEESLLSQVGLKYQAYDDIFFKNMKYISDSSCNWREGCMHEFIESETDRLCILTHPFWWYQQSSLENY